MLNTQEHIDLIEHFERVFGILGTRSEKEFKELWPRQRIYCHGETNELFLAFRHGYAFGKSVFQQAADNATP